MAYVIDPTNPASPADTDPAASGAGELRALKGYIQGLVSGGSSFTSYAWQGYRNRFVNGRFRAWQRGNSGPSTVGIRALADMFVGDSAGSSYVPSRQTYNIGNSTVPFEPQYFHRTVVTSVAGASNFCKVSLRVEGVRTFAGRTAFLSFWGKADATKNIAIETVQYFGTGGAPSGTVGNIGTTTKQLTNVFQQFIIPIAVPSILGKTIGTNNDDFIQVSFWFDAGSTFNSRTNTLGQQSGTFDLSEIQFEPDINTPIEILPDSAVTDWAQRYYCKTYDWDTPPTTITSNGNILKLANAGGNVRDTWDYPTRMRAIPVITYINDATGAGGTWRDGTATDRAIANVNVGQNRVTFSSAPTANATLSGHITADATMLVSV